MKTKILADRAEMEAVIARCPYCLVGLTDDEGAPYVIPMNFAYADGIIYLHSGPEGSKVRFAEQRPRVCITFCEGHELVWMHAQMACSYSMKARSVMCRGSVRRLTDLAEKRRALDLMMRHYTDTPCGYSDPAVRHVLVWEVYFCSCLSSNDILMSPLNFTHILTQAVDRLSAPESYEGLFLRHTEGNPLPSGRDLRRIVELARAVIFPGYFGNSTVNSRTLPYHIGVNIEQLFEQLTGQILAALCLADDNGDTSCCTDALREDAARKAADFISALPRLRALLATDVEAAYNGDPAARSFGEVISCYPCIRAISNYRIAHELLVLGVPLIPRIITEMAHSETGIDIHPGAQIGSYFTIDHGTGVVIGETCIIGDNVKLYQGVTLGAKSFPLDKDGNPIKGIPRHPILEDDVIVYSNATILGRITVGRGATVGGNIWVTEDVPAGARIVQRK